MNQSKHVKNLSKYGMRVIAKMRGINEKERQNNIQRISI